MLVPMRDDDDDGDELACHACGATIEGEPAGRGILVFPRGDDLYVDEPPLCSRCALAVGMTAMARWIEEEEEG
ncbi:MAG: hypothetical protein IT379_11630 [Deltaproteobacteria bacterium]|nr:hypothetical protein [Deltaproteobacteria bacterium]